jgi:TatD DNase family protein
VQKLGNIMENINPEKFPIFDSHAHLGDKQFCDDLDTVVDNMKKNGVVGVINCGIDYPYSQNCIKLAEKYDIFYAAVGVHPEDLYDGENPNTEIMNKMISHKKVVAIGEIGLDYYWDNSSREEQKKWFEQQILYAKEVDLPVIVHDREAHADTLEILKKYKPKGVVHCFSGSAEMAKEILKIGMYIGMGGVVTFKNARKTVEATEVIPLDRLMLETDAPFLAPTPFRGTRCTSDMIYFTAQKIAEIKNVPVEEVLNASLNNVKNLFTKINL